MKLHNKFEKKVAVSQWIKQFDDFCTIDPRLLCALTSDSKLVNLELLIYIYI